MHSIKSNQHRNSRSQLVIQSQLFNSHPIPPSIPISRYPAADQSHASLPLPLHLTFPLTNGLPTPQFNSHFIPIPTCPTHAQHVAAHVFSKYDVQQRRRPSYRDLKSNYHMPWQHQKACWIMEALSQDQTTLFYQGNSQAMRGFGRRDGDGDYVE